MDVREPGGPDWGAVTAEVVRALRGPRSREAFARRIGASANTVYAWETGRRTPTAAAVLEAAARLGADPVRDLCALLDLESPQCAPSELPGVLVARLRGRRRTRAIAREAGLSRFAVSRWASGSATPRFPDLLGFVEAVSFRGLDVVAALVDPATLPSAREAWRSAVAMRTAAEERPWVIPIELALALAEYRALPAHEPSWLAARLDLEVAEVESCVDLLVASGRVRWEGPHLVPVGVPVVQIASERGRRRLKAWCSRLAEEHLRGAAAGLYNASVFAVSAEARAHLEDLHRDHVSRTRAFLAAAPAGDHLMIHNAHLFPLS